MYKLKIFNALPKKMRIEILKRKMPHSFIIEATNICNQKCPACPWHSVMTRKKESLSLENFKKLFEKIENHAKAISFYLMGEPFLNPDIFKMISLCKKREVKTLISSNAMLIGDCIDEIFNSGLTTLQLTLDGFKKESHEKYRVGSDFATVVKNIRKIAEEKHSRNLKDPIIHIQTLLFKHNRDETQDIEAFAREIGADHYSIKAPSVSVGYEDKKRQEFVDEFMERDDNLIKYDRMADRNDVKFYKNQSFCPQLSHCVVLVNGDVAPCCFDYDGSVKFGNLFEQSLNDIWKSKGRSGFIGKFLEKRNGLCAKCDIMSERGISVF